MTYNAMSNDQQKMTKQPKNDRQSITQKIKDLETWTPLKTGGGISLPINKSMINIPESNVGDTSLISERLKSYPRVSEISLSCTFCRCLILFLTFNSCFSFVFVCKLHVNNVSYFPFMSIKKEIPYFCVLCEDYYVIIWLIVRICVFIKDWKLIYSELFILVPRVAYLLHELLRGTYSKINVCFVFFFQCWMSATL